MRIKTGIIRNTTETAQINPCIAELNVISFMLVSFCLFPVNLCKPEISDE